MLQTIRNISHHYFSYLSQLLCLKFDIRTTKKFEFVKVNIKINYSVKYTVTPSSIKF